MESRPLTPAPPLDESRAIELVEAAARHRLHRKAAAFRIAERLSDREDALFQALATGLGYRNNKIPFLLIAQRATLARCRAEGGEALLFGLAGFLDAETFDEGTDDVRAYLAPLWEEWWRIRAREERLILPAAAWRLAGIRPANHPHRRLGALAAIVARFGEITRALDAGDCGAFTAILQTLRHRYWTRTGISPPPASLATSPSSARTAPPTSRSTPSSPPFPTRTPPGKNSPPCPAPPPAANSAMPPNGSAEAI